jgi:hypothetical protein
MTRVPNGTKCYELRYKRDFERDSECLLKGLFGARTYDVPTFV